MKTGNSILAVFFFYTAYYVPVEIYTMQRVGIIDQVIQGVDWEVWLCFAFAVCFACGVVALVTGIERKKKSAVPDFSVPSEKKEIVKPESKSLKASEKIIKFEPTEKKEEKKQKDVDDIESHVDAITKEKI